MVTSGVSGAARSVPRDDTGPVTETASAQHGFDRQNTLFNTKMQRHRHGGSPLDYMIFLSGYRMHHIQRIPTVLPAYDWSRLPRENSASRLTRENSATRLPRENSATRLTRENSATRLQERIRRVCNSISQDQMLALLEGSQKREDHD
jgi:hypothetical protein